MSTKCDRCGNLITTESHDIMMSVTVYDADGEPVKSMLEPNELIKGKADYVIFCPSCNAVLTKEWAKFLTAMAVK